MRTSINALLRTMILLICSIVQVFEIIFRGIGEMFVRLSDLMKALTDQAIRGLDQGKYEANEDSIIEMK